MLSGLDWALAVAALVAGVTGTWSPCGLSTIETLGVGGMHEGGRRTAAGASVAFSLGAVAGGVLTFATLSLIGALASFGGGAAGATVALVIAAAAALLEAAGARIVPQVRRQVPETWRRSLPVTVVAALYGGLLGLGFTTFVMTFAVWALAGIVVALGSPQLGLVVGVAFGLGRALPVTLLSPVADTEVGECLLDTMTQRRFALRGLRLADAGALAAVALALAGPAGAATPGAATAASFSGAQDPSAVLGQLAWEETGVGGFVRSASGTRRLPGDEPALGGSLIAWRNGSQITVADRLTLAPRFAVAAAGADELAVSNSWLVYRVPPPLGGGGHYTLYAVSLPPSGPPHAVAAAAAPSQLGRPALDGSLLTFHAAGRESRILEIDLSSSRVTVLRRDPFAQLLNPSLRAGSLLYVRIDDCRQELMLGSAAGRSDRVLASSPTQVARDGGYGPGAIREGRTPNHCIGPLAPGPNTTILDYWTTALSPTTAYLTELRSRSGVSHARLRGLGL